jgi:hypothetical protein
MRKIIWFLSLSNLILVVGCSSLTKSTMLGIAVGSGTGALLGSAVGNNGSSEDRNKSALIGSAIGATIGGLLVYHDQKTKEEKRQTNFKLESGKVDDKIPNLLMPSVRKVWSPEKISEDGRQFEAGHWIYIIDRTSTWSK